MHPNPPHGVCLLGFSDFERQALTAHFRLALQREPAYTLVAQMDAARFLVVDADASGWVGRVAQAGRGGDTVFVGSKAPAGALVRLPRPIDALHVLRELDVALLAHRRSDAAAAARDNPNTEPSGLAPRSQFSELAALFPDRVDAARSAPKADAEFDALLVDDSEVALRFLELKLAELGLRSRSVSDSDAALAQLARHHVAWVFVDVELGAQSRLDGLALCRRIKAMASSGGAPLVAMVSAHASATDRVRGSLAGCDAYLGKPLVLAELAALVAGPRNAAPQAQRR